MKINKLLKKEVFTHKIAYLLVGLILFTALLLRTWRTDQLLGFYYDQGRDALIISKMLQGDIVLIGPTTGINGVFLGPFYYYLLLPGYALGGGDPVVASYWQTIFILLGYMTVFILARIYFSFSTAILSILLMTFSFYLIKLDRWLSNPAPVAAFASLTVLFLSLSFRSPNIFLPLGGFGLGLMLQLEASSSFFLTIITLIFITIYRKVFGLKAILLSLIALGVTFIPQAVFELKNNFLISKLLLGFLTGKVQSEGSTAFQVPNLSIIQGKLDIYTTYFLEKIKLNADANYNFLFVLFLILSVVWVKSRWSNPSVKVMAFWFYGLLSLFLFYSGNYGQINSYYFLPVYPIFFLFLASMVSWLWKVKQAKVVILIMIALFLYNQLPLTLSYLNSGTEGKATIALGNQVQAVKYILEDVRADEFNVDVYVPPVVPYTYDYLFNYYGQKINKNQSKSLVNQLYTLHELDVEMPEREEKWLQRQATIGKIVKQVQFGGITVERRERIAQP